MLRRRGIPARALLIGDGADAPGDRGARARRSASRRDALITGLQQDVRPLLAACDAVGAVQPLGRDLLARRARGDGARPAGGARRRRRRRRDDRARAQRLPLPGRRHAARWSTRLATLADPALRARMGAQARATVEARFSERAMVDRYETRFEELDIAKEQT